MWESVPKKFPVSMSRIAPCVFCVNDVIYPPKRCLGIPSEVRLPMFKWPLTDLLYNIRWIAFFSSWSITEVEYLRKSNDPEAKSTKSIKSGYSISRDLQLSGTKCWDYQRTTSSTDFDSFLQAFIFRKRTTEKLTEKGWFLNFWRLRSCKLKKTCFYYQFTACKDRQIRKKTWNRKFSFSEITQ